MGSKTRMVLCAVVVLLIVATAVSVLSCDYGGPKEVSLAYVFQPGQTWVTETSSEYVIENDPDFLEPGEPLTETHEKRKRTTAVVDEVAEDASITLSVTIETLERSTDGEPEDLEDPLQFEVTVDPTGKVLEVVGFEDAAEEAAASDDPDLVFAYMADFTQAFSVCTVEYPKEGVAVVGDQWVVNTIHPVPGQGQADKCTTTYTLAEIRKENGREVAVITYVGRDTTDLAFDISDVVQADFREEFEGTEAPFDIDQIVFKTLFYASDLGKGEYLVDLATGIPISASGSSEGTLEWSSSGTPTQLFNPAAMETMESSASGSYSSRTVE